MISGDFLGKMFSDPAGEEFTGRIRPAQILDVMQVLMIELSIEQGGQFTLQMQEVDPDTVGVKRRAGDRDFDGPVMTVQVFARTVLKLQGVSGTEIMFNMNEVHSRNPFCGSTARAGSTAGARRIIF